MSKTGWTETFRGMVKAWECDAFEHFTVAYYFERIADAIFNLLDEVDAGPAHARDDRRALVTVATVGRFEAELLESDLIHVESGFHRLRRGGSPLRPQALRLGERPSLRGLHRLATVHGPGRPQGGRDA